MKINLYTIVSLLVLMSTSCDKKNNEIGETIRFNSDWQFKIDEEATINKVNDTNDANFIAWEKVHLPHTPKIEPLLVNDQWQGISWYKKEFQLSQQQQHQQLYLKFEAAMNIAEVWVNNEKLMTHQGGYLPFVVDFTLVANFKKTNTVLVKLNNQDNPVTGPKPLDKLDFNTYGGLYRNVWLISKNKLHITDPILEGKTASGGIFVQYADVSEEKASVHIQTHIRNTNEKATSFFIRNSLYYKDSLVVSKESEITSLEAHKDTEVHQTLSVAYPELWSPSHPNLYQLVTEIVSDEQVTDKEETRIGIKTMHFEGQDFYLNGKKTVLRGVNRHQEYPYIGYALSENANYRDAKKIKEAGFDYVRISHYPQSPAFMKACDELGLLTINAILGWQYFSEEEAFQQQVFQTARDLVRRDRNHASVLAWEVSLNESWMPEPFIDSLTQIAHAEYPGDQCFTAGWQSYGYDIYLQARQHRLDHYDEKLTKPYVVSEYGDWEYYAMNAGLNQDNWGDLLQEERSSRQLRSGGEKALLQQATNIQEAHNDNLKIPAFADGYWVMFDYNRGYADDLEASGIMDIFRLPKPAYYFYQSQRNHDEPFGKPMVHIANQWKENSPLEVRIFSNADQVELFLNGKSLGKQIPDENDISTDLNHPPFTFKVAEFEAGTLEAKAFINDEEVASHIVKTPQQATQLEVSIDESGYPIHKEQEDVVFVYAKIVDENNTLITDFEGEVTFEIEGDAQLIGENPVQVEAGIASILLKTNKNSNSFKISAKTENLSSTYQHSVSTDISTNKTVHNSKAKIPAHFLTLQNKSKGYCLVQGDSLKKQIALTFDDGPTDVSYQIIELLGKYDAKATFFWVGERLKNHQDNIVTFIKQGHLIANHSWNHANGSSFSNEFLWKSQVEKCLAEFSKKGVPPSTYYRPPFGAITQEQIDFLASKNIKTVLWSITTLDWDKEKNKEGQLFKKFKEELYNGAIVLMHDFDFGNVEAQLKDLEKMLKYGKYLGFQFVTLQDLERNS